MIHSFFDLVQYRSVCRVLNFLSYEIHTKILICRRNGGNLAPSIKVSIDQLTYIYKKNQGELWRATIQRLDHKGIIDK